VHVHSLHDAHTATCAGRMKGVWSSVTRRQSGRDLGDDLERRRQLSGGVATDPDIEG
jgi:hypothetical protein